MLSRYFIVYRKKNHKIQVLKFPCEGEFLSFIKLAGVPPEIFSKMMTSSLITLRESCVCWWCLKLQIEFSTVSVINLVK